MFEIPSSTLQFVTTAYPNGRLRGGNFGVSFWYMVWTRFLRWAFFINAFASEHQFKTKRPFWLFFNENRKWPFAAFLRNSSQNRKNVHQFIHFHKFCLNFIGKDEVFHGLLYLIICFQWCLWMVCVAWQLVTNTNNSPLSTMGIGDWSGHTRPGGVLASLVGLPDHYY